MKAGDLVFAVYSQGAIDDESTEPPEELISVFVDAGQANREVERLLGDVTLAQWGQYRCYYVVELELR